MTDELVRLKTILQSPQKHVDRAHRKLRENLTSATGGAAKTAAGIRVGNVVAVAVRGASERGAHTRNAGNRAPIALRQTGSR